MGLQAEIWAWRLGEGEGAEEKKEEEEEKIPHMCESTGHRHWTMQLRNDSEKTNMYDKVCD